MKKITKIIILFIYVITALFFTFHSIKNPDYNWDGLAYVGIVNSFSESDAEEIHKKTYKNFKETIPENKYYQLIDEKDKYRTDMYQNAEYFVDQFPFYTIKPIYIGLIYLMSKIDKDIVDSTVTISAFSYLGICLVLLLWLKKFNYNIFFSLGMIFLITSKPIMSVASLSTPDALSAFILLVSFYFLLEKKNKILFLSLLILSIFIRADNIIIIFLSLFAFKLFYINKEYKLSNKEFFIAVIVTLTSYFSITHFTENFGWWTLFHHTFIEKINMPSQFHEDLSIKEYLIVMEKVILQSYKTTYYQFIFLAMLSLLMILQVKEGIKYNKHLRVILISIVSMIAHIIIFPSFDDRFFIFQYIMIILVLMDLLYVKQFGNKKEGSRLL